jgi:pyruvate dehydrogenase E1 component alpha subunit
MHLLDTDRGYYGGWGIVAGQLPIATGLALALVRQGKPQAVLCELGDGAVNMGAWHESLNLAALWELPVVFLVVNNGYGMGTSVARASAEPDIWRRASAFRMHGERVDGDDLGAVLDASERLLAAARNERRPAVLEAVTYRYRGHSVADAGLAYRTKEEIAERKAHDPIERVRRLLLESGTPEAELDRMAAQARERVLAAVEHAEQAPDPSVAELAVGMHAAGSAEQFERMRPGSAFGELDLSFDAGLGR